MADDSGKPEGWLAKITRKLEQHPAIKLTLLVAGLYGVIQICSSFLPRTEDGLRYAVVPSSIDFRRPDDSRLAITYDGKPVTDVAVFFERVIIWNGGTKAISRGDVLKPLSVQLEHGNLLTMDVAKLSREEIRAKLTPTGANAEAVDFAVLEADDGLNVDIIYSGSQRGRLFVDGTVVGQKGGPVAVDAFTTFSGEPASVRFNDSSRFNWGFIGAIASGIIAGAIRWLGLRDMMNTEDRTHKAHTAGVFVFLAVAVLAAVGLKLSSGRFLPVPAALLTGREVTTRPMNGGGIE